MQNNCTQWHLNPHHQHDIDKPSNPMLQSIRCDLNEYLLGKVRLEM